MKNYESLVDALSDLKERGYDADFETTTPSLYCSDLDIRLDPDAFQVDEIYWFEGDSSLHNNSTLFAISSSIGVKGTVVDAYGGYAENLSFEMASKLGGHHALMHQ